ncbi:hypothetical protein UO65_0362 [Actinokineospora spheciospongiae]|uniref:Uncharacterized protein n=1 Tax=Actinokineospora spheciospongiae TaxID=909613 RepID=W7IVB9_9PSEU|nr:hypothetical protein UO65_0362 [Actinokineospora spheciospongiae]
MQGGGGAHDHEHRANRRDRGPPAPGSRLPAPGSRLPAPGSRLDIEFYQLRGVLILGIGPGAPFRMGGSPWHRASLRAGPAPPDRG